MRNFPINVKFAWRAILRSPAFFGVAVLCLSVGIGALTTMSEIVDLLLFRPPPHVASPQEIAEIQFSVVRPGEPSRAISGALTLGPGVTYADYLGLEDSLRTVRSIAGYHIEQLSLGRGASAQAVKTAFVTGTFFTLLGVPPALGSLIGDDGVGEARAAQVAVLSYGLWQSRFGGDSSILGRSIRLGKNTYLVNGVAPPGFRGMKVLEPVDIWVPIGAAVAELFKGKRDSFVWHSERFVNVVGRFIPGMPRDRVAAEASAVQRAAFASRFGEQISSGRVVATIAPIIMGMSGERSRDASVSLWLTAVGAIVLAIACANVAGLLLARASDRRREVGIRLALGATRSQLLELFLIEGMILATVAGLIGLVVRWWGSAIVRAFLLPGLDIPNGGFGIRVLAIAAIVTVATGVACGLAPGLYARRQDLTNAMSDTALVGRRGRIGARSVLLVGQVALALALLAAATLFVSSWWHVRSIDLGFSPDNVIVGRMDLRHLGYGTVDTRAAYSRMMDRVRALPGIEGASLSSRLPFVGVLGNPMTIPGVEPAAIRQAARSPLGPEFNAVSPTYFNTIGTPLRRGRLFDDGDRLGTEPVAIVNEKMARVFWPANDAIGQCIEIQVWGPSENEIPCSRIVGIVADTKSTSVREEPDLQVYAPLQQRVDVEPSQLIVRTGGDAEAFVSAVRSAMQSSTSGTPYADVRPLSTYIDPELRPWRIGAAIFALFGAVALGLAAVGLYGVFSYAVSRRTREIGIRAALGAREDDILRMVLLEGARLYAVGGALGALMALIVGRLFGSLLVGVTGTSPVVLGASLALVLLVMLIAVGVPARRAARIDPAMALRDG